MKPTNKYFFVELTLCAERRQTIIYTAVIAVATLILSFLITLVITSPMTTLSTEMKKITNMNFSSTYTKYSALYEIYSLQRSFFQTRAALASFGKYVPKDVIR